MSVSTFIREISKTLGILPTDITLDSKTSLSTFFVINSTANYNALLGRDWIHANWCLVLPSQFLLLWKGDEVEVVWVEKQPFIATLGYVEASYYDQEFGLIKFEGEKKDGALKEIYMKLRDTSEIQDQVTKLLKIITVMPFMPIKGPIIEEIDD